MKSFLLILIAVIIALSSTANGSSAQQQQVTNMTRIDNITTYFGEGVYNGAVHFDGKGYFATFTTPGRIVRIDLATLTREHAITIETLATKKLPADVSIGNFRQGIRICGFAYFPCATNPGRFAKIDLSPANDALFRMVGYGSGLKDTEFSLVAPVTYGDLIFFGTKTNPARVVSFSLGNLERLQSAELPLANVNAAVSQGRVAFYALEGSNVGSLVKFDLETMTVLYHYSNSSGACCFQTMAASIPYNTFSRDPSASSSALFASSADAFLFVASGTTVPGTIYKFSVSSSVNGGNITLLEERQSEANFWMVQAAVVDSALIVLQTSDPGAMLRLDDIADFQNESRYSNVTGLETGEDFNVFLTDGEYAYVGTNSNPARIIKYHLGLPNASSSASTNSSSSSSSSSVMYYSSAGNPHDNFGGTGTLDINTTLCVDRGTYVGRNLSIRLAPDTNLLEARRSGTQVWGTVSDDFFTANTAAALCRLLSFDVTWATWYRAGATWHGLSSLLLSNGIVSTQQEADWLVGNASSTSSLALSSSASAYRNRTIAETRLKSLLQFPVLVDDLECSSHDVDSLEECTLLDHGHPRHDAGSAHEAVGLNCTVQDSTGDGIYSGGFHWRLARNGRLDVKAAAGAGGAAASSSWDAVCNAGFTQFTASGLCRVMGFPYGVGYLTHFYNGSGDTGGTDNTSKILLTGVQCPASLNSFADCRYLVGTSTEGCTREQDVGLLCSGTRSEGTYVGNGKMMRLTTDGGRLEVKDLDRHIIANGAINGSVAGSFLNRSINVSGVTRFDYQEAALPYEFNSDEDPSWSTVCAQEKHFSVTTAQALCNMLGFNVSSYAAFSVNDSSNVSGTNATSMVSIQDKAVAMTAVECFSTRPVFFGVCVFSDSDVGDLEQCRNHKRDVVLMCEAEVKGVQMSSSNGDDVTFRFDPAQNNLLEARTNAAVYSSSSNVSHWSTVCGGSSSSSVDSVVCGLLGFWGSKHIVSTSSLGGSGALLDNASCSSSSSSSSSCNFNYSVAAELQPTPLNVTTTDARLFSCLNHQSDMELSCDAGSDSTVDSVSIIAFVVAAVGALVTAVLLAVCIGGGCCCSSDDSAVGAKEADDADSSELHGVVVEEGGDDEDDGDEIVIDPRTMTSPDRHHHNHHHQHSRPPPPARDATITRDVSAHQERSRNKVVVISPPLDESQSFVGRLRHLSDPDEGHVVPRNWRQHPLYLQQQQQQRSEEEQFYGGVGGGGGVVSPGYDSNNSNINEDAGDEEEQGMIRIANDGSGGFSHERQQQEQHQQQQYLRGGIAPPPQHHQPHVSPSPMRQRRYTGEVQSPTRHHVQVLSPGQQQ